MSRFSYISYIVLEKCISLIDNIDELKADNNDLKQTAILGNLKRNTVVKIFLTPLSVKKIK